MTWAKTPKGASSFVAGALAAIVGYLLNEDGTFLCQESGGKIVLERDWSETEKGSSSFTRVAKEAASS